MGVSPESLRFCPLMSSHKWSQKCYTGYQDNLKRYKKRGEPSSVDMKEESLISE